MTPEVDSRLVPPSSRTLCAILLNPALREQRGTTTYRNVTAALPLFGCEELVVANLLNTPTKDAPELNRRTPTQAELEGSRAELALAVKLADEVLLAWGTGGMTGEMRLALRRQVSWLYGRLVAEGVERVWTVTGRPRHPSRWRQYVGPEKRRVEGDCFEDRLQKVLVALELNTEEGRLLFERAF